MPRNSRHKSHRQHHRRLSVDSSESDDEGSTRYGPEILLPEGKSKGSRADSLKEKHGVQAGDKRKSSASKEQHGSADSLLLPSKKKRASVSVSAERWEAKEDALSMLAYLDHSKEKDSKADSDSSGEVVGDKERSEKGFDKSRRMGPNGVDETRVSRSKETLEHKVNDSSRGKSRGKSDGDETKMEVKEAKRAPDLRREGSVSVVAEAVKCSEDAGKQGSQSANCPQEASQKKGQRNTEWKIQDELRNLELEKELENRILRRREESGDRDRWRDDDRDREGKSYRSRDSHHKDERHNDGKQKDDKLKGARCKDERKSEDKPRANKYKEERHVDDKPRADRYKDDKQRDEKPREERHRDVKQKDDKHKEEKYRDDKNKTDKNKEDKLEDSYREDKYKEDRYMDEKHRDDRYKDDKSKDEKYRLEQSHRDCPVEHHDSKHSKDESKQRARYKESKHYESDQEYSSYLDDRCPEQDTSHNRHPHKPEGTRLRRSRESKDSPDDDCGGTSRACEDDLLVQERLVSDLRCSSIMDVAANDNQEKRACEVVSKIGREQKRVKSVEGGSEWKDTLFQDRPRLGRNNQHAQKFEHDHGRLEEQDILRTRNRTERYLDGHREESPVQSSESSLKSNGFLSPMKMTQRSSSPSTNGMSHRLSYEKTNKRKRLENDHGFSSVTVTRGETRTGRSVDHVGDSDRSKPHSDHQSKMRDRESVVVLKDSEDHRGRSRSADRVCRSRSTDRVRRSRSTDRVCSSHLNDSKSDRFSRAPSVHAMDSTVTGPQDDVSIDHYSKRPFTSGHSSLGGEGPKTSYHSDKMATIKSGWSSHFAPNSRSGGPPVQQRTPYHIRPSGHLPPPPPFRPGIDNPSVLGPSNGGFEEGHCSRDQGRADWNTSATFNRGEFNGPVRNWNSQAQGPGSSNFFIPFHHQAGSHPPGAFHNMGQQHTGPPLFRGLRPPMDMAHSGIPYHMWDNGDGNPAHNGAFGWQRQADDVRGPVQGSFHGWDGYAEESMMYGRREWYTFGQGMGNRGWDRPVGTGKGQKTDMNMDFSDHNDSNYQGHYNAEELRSGTQDPRDRREKLKSETSPTENIDIKCNQVSQSVVPEISLCAISSDATKYKHKSEDMRHYLLKLDISAELVGPDLYNQYIDKLGTGKTMNPDEANFSTDKAYEDHQLEVDTDTEAFISSFDLRRAFFPNLPENCMQRVMEINKQARQRSWDAATLDTPGNFQIAAKKQSDKSSLFSDSKEELWCAPDNGPLDIEQVPKNKFSPHNSLVSEMALPCLLDAAVHNDVKRGQEVPKAASEGTTRANQSNSVYHNNAAGFSEQQLNDSISEKIKLNEKVLNGCIKSDKLTGPENFGLKTVDSCTVFGDSHNLRLVAQIGSATTTDSERVSEKLEKKHREDVESCSKVLSLETHSFSCKFCAKEDSVGLNGICVRCQGGNQPNADLCGDTPIQQDELLDRTRITHEEALKFGLVDFKGKNRECQSQYNLPENTR